MPQEKAGQLVNNFLSSLQTLDNTLISSLRSKTAVPDSADKEVEQAVQDLDRCAPRATPLSICPCEQCSVTSTTVFILNLLCPCTILAAMYA